MAPTHSVVDLGGNAAERGFLVEQLDVVGPPGESPVA